MSRRQLAALFLCNLVPWTAGNGLIPLLPLYAAKLGADSAVSGYYLAISYLAIALGALSAGWVSNSLHRRKLPIILSSLVGIPVAWLMGRVGSIWGLVFLTALMWFSGGLGLALMGILTGLSAGENERGRVFGILALTGGLGALSGGLAIGWLVNRWGYPTMFSILAVFLIVWPACALFLEEKDDRPPQAENAPIQPPSGLGKGYYLLFSASILASITSFVIVLVRSIVMNRLSFDPLAISSTGAVGGLVSMPLPLLMGWLSDRTGRKVFLYAGYLAGLASLVLLAFSIQLWQFWLVFVMQGIATQGNGTIGNALVTDLVPRQSLGKGMALFSATAWIGGVLGFALAGYALQNLGLMFTFIISGCFALAAIGLLIPIRAKRA